MKTHTFLQSADKWKPSSLTIIIVMVITVVIFGKTSSPLDECERQPRDGRPTHTHTRTLSAIHTPGQSFLVSVWTFTLWPDCSYKDSGWYHKNSLDTAGPGSSISNKQQYLCQNEALTYNPDVSSPSLSLGTLIIKHFRTDSFGSQCQTGQYIWIRL